MLLYAPNVVLTFALVLPWTWTHIFVCWGGGGGHIGKALLYLHFSLMMFISDGIVFMSVYICV